MINVLDPAESLLRERLAANMRQELARLGRTPYWLAKQMGVGPSSVDHILKCRNTASAWFLVRAAQSLGVTVNDLVAMQESSGPHSRKNLATTA